MIAYIQKVEEGQWGWVFDPSTVADPSSTLAAVLPTGDHDLDELQEYLGVDKDEISAEELLARPYVPHENHQFDPSTMTAAGISTMAMSTEYVCDLLPESKKLFTFCIFGLRVNSLIKHLTFFFSFHIFIDRDEGEDALEAAKRGSVETLQKALSTNPDLVNIKDDMVRLLTPPKHLHYAISITGH